jgi:hypothetical protein
MPIMWMCLVDMIFIVADLEFGVERLPWRVAKSSPDGRTKNGSGMVKEPVAFRPKRKARV